MAKRKGLLTAEELNRRFPKSLKEAIDLSIEKYKRLLANWTKATAKQLSRRYIRGDTCALCQFLNSSCIKCPLWLKGVGPCGTTGHPYDRMESNLFWNRKARARKYAEQVLALLRKKARSIK